jgi:hypothetical protein
MDEGLAQAARDLPHLPVELFEYGVLLLLFIIATELTRVRGALKKLADSNKPSVKD